MRKAILRIVAASLLAGSGIWLAPSCRAESAAVPEAPAQAKLDPHSYAFHNAKFKAKTGRVTEKFDSKSGRSPVKRSMQEEDYLNDAFMSMQRGDFAGAIEAFTKAIEANPNCVDAYANRGMAHLMLRHYRSAIKDETQAVSLAPDWSYPLYVRGRAYYEVKDFNGALADFNMVLAIDPDDWQTHWWRCWLNIDINNLADARKDCLAMIRIADDFGHSHRIYGYFLTLLGQTDSAISEYMKAADLYHADNDPEYQKMMLEAIASLKPPAKPS